jgi:hypothetical protein
MGEEMKSNFRRAGLILVVALFLGISLFATDAVAYGYRGNSVEKKNAVQDWDMTWSGRVDDRVQIRVSGRSARARVISGQRLRSVNSNFRNSLPRRSVNVRVNKRDGRGSVRVVEQPNSRNNYTAVIEIDDDKGGADYYRFELSWDNGGGYDPRPDRPNYSGRADMTWEGRVDERVRVTVRGRYATALAIRGRYPTQVRPSFRRSLPSSNVRVNLRKLDGRGTVRLIQQPSRSNGYAAVVEIYDSRGGDDYYSFELDWDQGYGDNRPDYDNNNGGSMNWSGSVDDVAVITIRGRSATSRITSGQPLRNVRYNFNESLPRRNVTVRVNKREGRGSVRVLTQPRSYNNYSAVIEIRDSSGGRDNYRLEINW